MVNTRAQIKKLDDTLKTYFSQASMADSDDQYTESGALIGSNDDLLTEILRRLPATSILRFKSVSKHWRSLLSHRRFTVLYDSVTISPGLFIRNMYIPFDVENRSPPPFRTLDFYPDRYGITIVQSCNGLLLCCSDQAINEGSRKYYVFNPTTKQFAIVPSVPVGQDVRNLIFFMGLAFHQTDCVHYKVVCIHRAKPDDERFGIQVYSSATRKWKMLNESFTAPLNSTSFFYGVYWNGSIHWAPSSINTFYLKLDTEQLQKLPLPSPLPARLASSITYMPSFVPLYFGESRGHLHLVETTQNPFRVNVYEMLSDHSRWFIKYKVKLDELRVAYPDMIDSSQFPYTYCYYQFEIIDVVRGEEEEDTFIVVRSPTKIISYNVHDKSFEKIFELADIYDGKIGFSYVHRYIQTLTYF